MPWTPDELQVKWCTYERLPLSKSFLFSQPVSYTNRDGALNDATYLRGSNTSWVLESAVNRLRPPVPELESPASDETKLPGKAASLYLHPCHGIVRIPFSVVVCFFDWFWLRLLRVSRWRRLQACRVLIQVRNNLGAKISGILPWFVSAASVPLSWDLSRHWSINNRIVLS